ncbi:hypothetical protein NXV14_04845 [Bacteroides fragilis]|nr:hypothetical protein [Bacteroides fragilis]
MKVSPTFAPTLKTFHQRLLADFGDAITTDRTGMQFMIGTTTVTRYDKKRFTSERKHPLTQEDVRYHKRQTSDYNTYCMRKRKHLSTSDYHIQIKKEKA